jgi:uncharacterized Tic20 family protein
MNVTATSDEKVMAALAHGSILLAFLGPIVPAIVWMSQRKKSKYVAFHALQAMGYQALMFWLWIVVGILIMVFAMCLVFPLSIFVMENSDNPGFAPFVFQNFIFLFIFGCMGLLFLTAIAGAIFCLTGREFRYPLLGKWLEKYLAYDPEPDSQLDEAQEDHWVAGICHAMAILQLWGIVTPLIVWFTQKERSARLRFQAMQAFVYQLIAFVVYMLGMVLYMFFFFGMFFLPLALWQTSGSREIQGPAGPIMLIFFGVMMLFWLAFTILMPIYYLLAGFASIRVIQGRPFHYPILGNILEKRMGPPPTREPIA